jgi:hypothetical protein
MYLFILSIACLVLGIFLVRSYHTEDLGVALILIFGVTLLVQMVMLTNHYSCKQSMREREAFRKTLNEARKSGEKLENATILKDLADWNKFVVSVQMDNEFWFDIYVPDAVDTMTLMK